LIKEKAEREYEIPFSKRTKLTTHCIKKWLNDYRTKGFTGLEPKLRSDCGKSKAFTEQEQAALIDYIENHPDVPATIALKTLQRDGLIVSNVSQSSLSRFIIASGLTKKLLLREKIMEKQLKFEFYSPLECVQADVLHTVSICDSKGKKRKALLMAFIDDATRRIVYSHLSFTEKASDFLGGIIHILKAHGRIGKLYVDNGAAFISNEVNRILSILGITISHSRVRRPAGRGKIERFFRTARDGFFRPLEIDLISSIDDLNIKFNTWLESEYHRNPHKGLSGKTPLESWLGKSHLIISMPQDIDLDDVFKFEKLRRVYKDNTFTLNSILYEVPGILAGKNIKIRYSPFEDNPKLQVIYDKKYFGYAKRVETYANTKIKRSTSNKNYTESDITISSHHINASLSASVITGGPHDK
jgi:transposase InsO family protein